MFSPIAKLTSGVAITSSLLLAALTSCSTPTQQTTVTTQPVSTSYTSDGSVSSKIFEEVNTYRRSQGRSNLVRHAGLDRLAQEHCEYLLKNRGKFSLYGKNVSHMGFESRLLVAREKFSMPYVGENIASTNGGGANPAPLISSLWQNSSGHKHTMLSSWTYTGVGSVKAADGTVITTQMFGSPGKSYMDSRDRFRMH